MENRIERDKQLILDGAWRGMAFAYCTVSLYCVLSTPIDLAGLFWLGCAAFSIGVSWLLGWCWGIE